jgi:hypothetical protein
MTNFFSIVRYIIPGGVAIFLIFLASFFISGNKLFQLILCIDSTIVTLTITVLSIGLGFILSMVYRYLYPSHGLNHIDILNHLLEQKSNPLEVKDKKGYKLEKIMGKSKGNKRDSYRILAIFWHLNKSKFDNIKDEFFGNMFNSIGTMIVAVFFSFAVTLLMLFPLSLDFEKIMSTGKVLLMSSAVPIILLSILFLYRKSLKHDYITWVESTIVSKIDSSDKCTYKEEPLIMKILYFNFQDKKGIKLERE